MSNDIIRVLPDSVANQIAAGEVIQCPASAVKELVENAVDAGATDIQLIVKDAGRTLIQVIDNGKGMSMTDARLAFERHATSKIRQADDLFALGTMGFRGEALASIAAVAQVEVVTKRADDAVGTRLLISGCRVESQEPAACSTGTNMMVKNLFFNVPARRKFLRRDSAEFMAVLHEFERLALVNPTVAMSLTHNGTVHHQLLPGTLKQRIGSLFGKSVAEQMLPLETETSLVKINGFVGRPDGARKRNYLQYLFVNGRNMEHRYFRKAVLSCYEKLISADVQPNYFINFEVDPATIDVNIHPTKNQIKFENEQLIWQILQAAVRESLGRFNVAPAMDFDDEGLVDIPVFAPGETLDIGPAEAYNPFAPENNPCDTAMEHPPAAGASMRSRSPHGGTWQRERDAALNDWDKLYDNWTTPRGDNVAPSRLNLAGIADEEVAPTAADVANVLQFKGKYIMTPVESGLLVVDRYRAHVNILYHGFMKSFEGKTPVVQSLIFPEMLEADESQDILLASLDDELRAAGFDLAPLGGGSWAINGVPGGTGDVNPVELLRGVLEAVTQETRTAADNIQSAIALSMARSGALKAGRTLTPGECESLLGQLLSLPTPTYTPDGLLVMHVMGTDTLTRPF